MVAPNYGPDEDLFSYIAEEPTKAKRLRATRSPKKLVDLIPIAEPDLLPVWRKCIAQLGLKCAPPLIDRLVSAHDVSDPVERIMLRKEIACALFHVGWAAPDRLLDAFGLLDTEGRALASVVLGRWGIHQAADAIWETYTEARENLDTGWVLGPLWALLDLEDPRLTGAVIDLLQQGFYAPDLALIATHVDDERALVPLLKQLVSSPEPGTTLTAAVMVLCRNLPDERIRELIASIPPTPASEGLLNAPDRLLSFLRTAMSVELIDYVLEWYFGPSTVPALTSGMRASPDDGPKPAVAEALPSAALTPAPWRGAQPDEDTIEADPPVRTFRRAEERPGRNDPCWCGSGKKYKQCHMRSDQRKDLPQTG